MIALYKEIRPLVQRGVVHRISSPLESERVALEYVASDGSQAALLLYNLREYMAGSSAAARESSVIKLRGLDLDATYTLRGGRKGTISGETLMNIGLPWPLRGDFTSAVIVFQKQ